tara:strand:+ start:641 stop:757 length:117 start_codon:yes stop_codon:yes gene_type:complete
MNIVFPILIYVLLALIIIVLIIKRINDKKHEKFEKRDN